MITSAHLMAALGCSQALADKWASVLDAAATEFEINTPKRAAAWIAQVGQESGSLKWTREIWGPTPAQQGYEGRIDLGNVYPGDGTTYLGRGLIEITGRANYKNCGDALGVDLESHPELLEQPALAARSAAWFFKAHGCNELADVGCFTQITRRINGGLNGQAERLAFWDLATTAFA